MSSPANVRTSSYWLAPLAPVTVTPSHEIVALFAVAKFTGYASKNLKVICQEINEATIKNNVENGLQEPLIDVESMTLYVARHTKANDYLSHPNATLHALATLMGRSASTLNVYVHQIRGDRDLAAAESLSSI